jgi:gliding motility-associated-like protein
MQIHYLYFQQIWKTLNKSFQTDQGWMVLLQGKLPSDDYWYTVKLEDGREVKGHFSLKR